MGKGTKTADKAREQVAGESRRMRNSMKIKADR